MVFVLPGLRRYHEYCLHRASEMILQVISVVILLALHQVESSTLSESAASDPPTVSPETMWCPDACDCYNNMETLDCSQRRLHVVPGRLPQSARRIYLEDNDIGQIGPEEFTRSERLSQLVLDRNRLTTVYTATFCMLESLQELSLSANMINSFHVSRKPDCVSVALRQIDLSLNLLTAVPVDLSSFAPRLEILDLSCNEITSATLDSSYAELTSLRQLDLSRNRIHLLFAADLRPLSHVPLDVLNLAESELAVIEDEALGPLSTSLKYLSLTGNPLDADNLAHALSHYASGTPPPPMGLMVSDNQTIEQNASRTTENGLPLTRLSIGEMSVGNLTVDMLAQFHILLHAVP